MNAHEPDQSVLETSSEDLFLGDALVVRQPRNGYRAGTDAVLLAASIGPESVGIGPVLDVGSGVGVVGLCVAARCPEASVVLLEREPNLVALARHNIGRNGLAMRVSVVQADIARASDALDRAGDRVRKFRNRSRQPALPRGRPKHGSGEQAQGCCAPDATRRIGDVGAVHEPHGGAGWAGRHDPQDRGAAPHSVGVRGPVSAE